jgi:hypothetical protein
MLALEDGEILLDELVETTVRALKRAVTQDSPQRQQRQDGGSGDGGLKHEQFPSYVRNGIP